MPKTKTVFKSDEIAHVWASQKQPYGRCPSNMSFNGGAFYSYATVIARILQHKGEYYVIVDRESFSPSTSKHQRHVEDAVSHLRKFYVRVGRRGQSLDWSPKDLVNHYVDRAREELNKNLRTARDKYRQFTAAASLYEEALSAATFLGLGTSKLKGMMGKALLDAEPFRKDAEEWDEKRAERAEKSQATRDRRRRERWEQEARDRQAMVEAFLADHTVKHVPARWLVPEEKMAEFEAQKLKREAWEKEQDAKDYEDWKQGADITPPRTMPVAFRVEGNELVSTLGARVPLTEARMAWCFVQKVRRRQSRWVANGEQCPVGHYKLDSITESEVKAGCHTISFEELVRLGEILFTEPPDLSHEDTPPTMEVVA